MEEGSSSSTPIKLLVCGNVNGKVRQFLQKIRTINSGASGPFDALLVTQLIGETTEEENVTQETPSEIDEVRNGTEKVPIPTYFIDEHYKGKPGELVCPNLVFLGKAGVRTISGLKVTFVDYQFASELVTDTSLQVDVLLTNKWPSGILNDLKPEAKPQSPLKDDSVAITSIAKQLKPRYHFASGEEQFFERIPYKNGDGTITRFYGLAPAFSKQKYLFAVSINIKSLPPPPDIVTPNPYDIPLSFYAKNSEPKNKKQKTETSKDDRFSSAVAPLPQQQQQGGYNRWGLNDEQVQSASRNNKRRDNGHGGDPTKTCWFCLSNPNVETHLVVSVGRYTYLALAKGGFIPEHVLIIPIQHETNIKSLSGPALEEVEKYKTSLKNCFEPHGQSMIFIERHLPTKTPLHMHIQAAPFPTEKLANVHKIIESVASKTSMIFEQVPLDKPISKAIYEQHFVCIDLPDIRLVNNVTNTSVPMQFPRQILAEVLDFKQIFRPFDFTFQK